ncbi:MAG: TrkA family potassium uptake protein [Clostridia bacterium]|nr:TrkA family potassium uptake protein [Clostridia bacterium]
MKSFLLIGVNRFGSMLAKDLHDQGHEIMAIDRNEERINNILPLVTDALIGDSTNEAFLRTLGVDNYDVCIVTIREDFQSSLETTSLLKELGAKFVVSRANRNVQEKFLLRNGADEVINPDRQIAEWAAIRYASSHILDYIRLDDDCAIFEVPVPKEWAGKSIGQIDIRKKYGITIMAVRENRHTNLSVTPDTVLDSSKTLLVLGEQKSMQKYFHI